MVCVDCELILCLFFVLFDEILVEVCVCCDVCGLVWMIYLFKVFILLMWFCVDVCYYCMFVIMFF